MRIYNAHGAADQYSPFIMSPAFTPARIFCGMRERMDLFELADADLRVNLRGVELCMTEKLLDKADTCAVFQHERGAAVPEQVVAS